MKRYILLSLMFMVAGGMNIVGMEQKRCEICFEDKNSDAFKRLSCCAYDASCTDCLLELINTSTQEKTISQIVCPNRACAQSIVEQDIRAITQRHPEVYRMFCDIAAHEYVTKHAKHIKHCPTPNCPFSFENDQALKQAFNCPQCNHLYCSDCLVQHAPEMTCEQAREHALLIGDKTKANKANEEWLQKNTKACPQCKTSVEKNGGCYHMKCLQCKHEFCWKCLNPHDHTERHPCGVWENDAQMNQAHQALIGQGQGQPNGMNPLHMAAQHGHADIVRLLVEAGVDVNQAQPLANNQQQREQRRQQLNNLPNIAPVQIVGDRVIAGQGQPIANNILQQLYQHILPPQIQQPIPIDQLLQQHQQRQQQWIEAGADVNQAQPLANNQQQQQPNNIPFIFIQPQIIEPGANVNDLVNRNRHQRNEEAQPIANNEPFLFVYQQQQPNDIHFGLIAEEVFLIAEEVDDVFPPIQYQRNEEAQPIANNLQQLYQNILPPQRQEPRPIDQLLQQLRQQRDNALIIAVRDLNNPELVRALLERPDINVNMQDENGMNLLHIAAQLGNVDVARLLLNHPNIDVNVLNPNGVNAHAIALQQGHAEIVRLLIEAGIDIDVD